MPDCLNDSPRPLVQQVIQDISRRTRVEEPVVVYDLMTEIGIADARTHTIRLSRRIDEEPPSVQRWLVAHEFGHLCLAHKSMQTHVAMALGVSIVCAFGAGLALAVASGEDPFVALLVALGLALVGLQCVRLRCLNQERQADRLAAQWGYPLAGQEARDWALARPSLPALLRPLVDVHDSWPRRLRDSERAAALSS